MHVRDGQVTPMHFHWRKREDIINRGGGNLIIELWNAGAHEETMYTDVSVVIDGCIQTHSAGSQLRLSPGKAFACRPVCITAFGASPVSAMCWSAKCRQSTMTNTTTTSCTRLIALTTFWKTNPRSWCCVTNMVCF